MSTIGLKVTLFIVTARYSQNAPTEVKDIILSYPFITKVMVDLHSEILWADNYEAGLGCYPTENHVEGLDDPAN